MRALLFTMLLVLSMATSAAEQSVREILGEYAWQKRQLIVLTPDREDIRFRHFKAVKKEFLADFVERFLQVWTIEANKQVSLENMPNESLKPQPFYNHFKISTGEFAVILIGYDQGEKLRMGVFNIDRIMGEIDQMPMRQQEIDSQAQD